MPDMKVLLRLLPYFKGKVAMLMVGFAFMVMQNLGFTAMPAHFRIILDELMAENRREVIWEAGIWILGLMTVAGVGMFAMRKIIINLSRVMEYELRRDLFAILGRLPFSFYAKQNTGDLISRCTNDLNHVRVLLGPGIMYIPNSLSRLILFAPVLFSLDVTMTLMVMVQMTVLVTLIVTLMPRLKPLHSSLQQQVGAINDRVWQILTGMTTLKLYTRENVEERRFDDLNREYIRRHLRVERYQAFLWPLFLSLFGVSEIILLGWGGSRVIAGEMSLGALLQFKIMISVLAFPILSLGWVMAILQQGISAMERISLIMDQPPLESASGQWKKLQKESLELRLEGLSHVHEGSEVPALDDISLKIKPGEVVGITGPIGCGKSTLLQCIMGIIRPGKGQVYFNDIDILDLDPEEIVRVLSVVPQDAFLFSRPISENIALSGLQPDRGLNEAERERVRQCSEEAALGPDLEGFADGLETWVGERGVTLSGGQKQRVSLARALFKPCSLLILDDALSAVDAETEERIMTTLRAKGSQQGMLIVSHRISAIRHADRILVLEKGRLVEEGGHDHLMQQEGLYRNLADLQEMERDWEHRA